ncbi:MAG: phospho-N-acetylmuramoyl-pentapeptide-transferase [Firmicutes bacterium]|nr:phospho-N-acetylmuramoyl-pentapeptide-transferase [Bacillota bacterium]
MGESLQPLYVALVAFGVSIIAGPFVIRYLRYLKFGQTVRLDGPRSHLKKSGTPSMGGVLILLAITLSVMLIGKAEGHLPVAIFSMLAFGTIGFVDDLINILTRKSLGLQARHKLAAQLVISLLIAFYALNQANLGPELLIPFLDKTIAVPSIIYVLLVVGVMLASTNAVNLTDGLDGLASGAMAIAAIAYALIAVRVGATEMALFAGGIVGACLGFIWFNAHPAQVFMGDTGSLGLGAALGVLAIFTRTSLILPIIGGLFVIETLSVIIQVIYFRLTGGKRIFRMAPLHHHFELKGWEEPKVMIRMWLVAIIFGAIGLLAVL